MLVPIFELFYDKKNITKDVSPYVTSIEYTDIEHGESDELLISFEDSEKLWQGAWIPSKGDCLRAYIGYEAEKLLNCGTFEIDELEYDTPPDVITVKGLATGIKKPLRQKNSQGYENKTLKQIAKEIDDFFIDNGAEDVAFSTIVASGKNSSMPHAVPTNKKIEAGDPITIDMGCKYKGYCSDMTRTIFAGYVPEEVKPVYELVLKNQRQVINEMKEGVNLKLVSRMVENDFKLHGYDLIHALGHGVGLQIHEFPYASTRIDFVLKNNMIVTDEPGIYIPNQFGVRIEDTVLVNRGMSTSLTKSEKDYVIVDA